MKIKLLRSMWILMGVALVLAISYPAQAATLTFELDHEFSNDVNPPEAFPPEAVPPWIRAVFDDGDTPGTVTLTLDNFNLIDQEFITGWYFNFDYNYNLNNDPLTITLLDAFDENETSIKSSFLNSTLSGIYQDQDEFQADGDGKYDILFSFNESDDYRFGAGQKAIFMINGDGITAESFNYLSAPAGGKGPFHTAAKVQGIGINDENSGWIAGGDGSWGPVDPIPEPSTFLLLGAGLLLLTRFIRKTTWVKPS